MGLAATAATFGAAVLISWGVGHWEWLALDARYVPTAPGTGMMALGLGVALLLSVLTPRPHPRARLIPVLCGGVLVLAIALALAERRGSILPLEKWFTQVDMTRGGVRLGQTALATSILFVVLSAGTLLRYLPRPASHLQAPLFLGVVISALILLQGYLFGGPLLYDRGVIPIAAPTALILLLLGTAALVGAGPTHWPMRIFTMRSLEKRSQRVRDARWLVVIMVGFVASSGYFWAEAEGDRVQARAERSLLMLANLKAAELAQWYGGYFASARAATALPSALAEVAVPDRGAPLDPNRSDALNEWLAELRTRTGATGVTLYDLDGRLLVSSLEPLAPLVAESIPRYEQPSTRVGVVVEFHHGALDGSTLSFLAPIREIERDSAAVAWIRFTVDAEASLFTLLDVSNDTTPSLELVLWRRVRDFGEVMNPVKGPDGTMLSPGLRVPIDSASEIPGVRGLLGAVGLVRGRDFRNIAVTAAAAPVPGTPWLLIAKMDLAVLRGSALKIGLRATALSVLFALGLGAALYATWSRSDLAAVSRELQWIRDREESVEALLRTDRILRLRSAANLALVRAETEGGMLQEISDVAVQQGGYRMAWVGRAEADEERLVRPIAVSGHAGDYLAANPISWAADDPRGDGPAGRCIRTGTAQAAQDLESERHFAPWRDAAISHGFAGCCAIPLYRGDQIFGALVLYSTERNAFDETEIRLLTEIGNDVSFGLGALRDRQAVAQQRADLMLFRQVMERSADAIFITDVATGKFLSFNAAASSWLGYDVQELGRMGPADVVPQVGGAAGWSKVVAQIRVEESPVWPRTFRRKDGTTFPVEVALTVIDMGGAEVILSIVRDISEREQLMDQLMRAQRMESVGRLAGGVAHDFNNLLTVINATVDLAVADAPMNTALQQDLAEIRGASDRAAALTRQLLAFSRQQVLHQKPVALNDLISGFLAMLRRVIGEDVEVRVDLAPAHPTVMADAGQLEQVLMNLSVNARDAMPNGGRLAIITSQVHLVAEDTARYGTMVPGDYAMLEVSDTGMGMDRQTQAMIFEPFYTTKGAGKGTGLGLSTVYGIIKQMGGGIWVTSEVGVGTTFTMYLPLATVAAVSGPPPAALQPSTGTERILVVEDEAAIRAVVRRVLERAGYTVLHADNGRAALDVLSGEQGAVDLIITDLVMPGMTGAELAAEVRRTHPEIPILMTSGYSADVVEGKIIPGVDYHFISKPYTAAELTEEVRRVLDGEVGTDRSGAL